MANGQPYPSVSQSAPATTGATPTTKPVLMANGQPYGTPAPTPSVASPNNPALPAKAVVTANTAQTDFNNKQGVVNDLNSKVALQSQLVQNQKANQAVSDAQSQADQAKFVEDNKTKALQYIKQNLGILSQVGKLNSLGLPLNNPAGNPTALSGFLGEPPVPTNATDTGITGTTGQTGTNTNSQLNQNEQDQNSLNNQIDTATTQHLQDLEQLRQGTFPLSAPESALLNSMQASLSRQEALQQKANDAYVAGVTTQVGNMGLSRYSPILAQGLIANAINVGIGKITDLDAKGAETLAKLQLDFQDKDYKLINDSYDSLMKGLESKQKALSDMHSDILKNEKDLRDYNLNVQKENNRVAEAAVTAANTAKLRDETSRHNKVTESQGYTRNAIAAQRAGQSDTSAFKFSAPQRSKIITAGVTANQLKLIEKDLQNYTINQIATPSKKDNYAGLSPEVVKAIKEALNPPRGTAPLPPITEE